MPWRALHRWICVRPLPISRAAPLERTHPHASATRDRGQQGPAVERDRRIPAARL